MAADLLNERLPPDWSYGVTGDGRVFFISEQHRETSWLHPVTGRPVQTGHRAAPGLPNGWEQDYTPEGVTYFIDHNNLQTSFGHPVTGRPVSEDNPPPPPRSPPQSPHVVSELRRGTTNNKQRSIKAPSAKRNPTAQVVRRGFLYRLESGGISKVWKRRWCVLADFALFIYKNDDEKAPLGSVLLPSYRINRCTSGDPVQKEFAFKVEHENTKTVYFHTDSRTDLDSWLSNLQMAATMKGNSPFYRETNNNIKPGGLGGPQRSPPFENQYRDYPNPSNQSPRDSRDPNREPQHETLPGSRLSHNSLPGQPTWKSVPHLESDVQDSRGQVNYDPQGSLRSLPHDVNRNQGFPSSGLRPDLRNHPHHQSYDPRLGRPRLDEKDPRGSIRSLQADPYKQVNDFVPLGQSRGSERDRGSYSQSGFQPHQRLNDPHQRSSMVSDSGQRYDPTGSSPQRSPGDGHASHSGSSGGAYQPRHAPQDSMRHQNRQTSDGSGGNRDSWQGNNSRPSNFHPQQRDSRSYPEQNRDYLDLGRGYPQRSEPGLNQDPTRNRDRFYPESNPRHNASRDPRDSYASSRHSMAGQNYDGDRDNQGSKQNLFIGSGNSLPRSQVGSSCSPQPAAHDTQSHTYVNIPEMQASQYRDSSPPPERPPYPAAVRDQIVQDLAEARSPNTAEKLIVAHELNKERMQRLPYFQYPTPPRDNTLSRVDESRGNEAVKRLSHYSDRNSFASNIGVRNDQGSMAGQAAQGPARDYADSGRRQDSGSGRFNDSFERRSAEDCRTLDVGKVASSPERNAYGNASIPEDRRFGGDPEAKTLRQAYERVQSFRQSSAANDGNIIGSSGQRVSSQNDVNFFEYSLNSQMSAGSFFGMNSKALSAAHKQNWENGVIRPKDSTLRGFIAGGSDLTKDDLDVSQATTLSPCGSYHHIDWNPDQLYQRGSAFRPPSASGSIRSDGLFHSLPRSYKFKCQPDAEKTQYTGGGQIPDKVFGGSDGRDSEMVRYKANCRNFTEPVGNEGIGKSLIKPGNRPREQFNQRAANGQKYLQMDGKPTKQTKTAGVAQAIPSGAQSSNSYTDRDLRRSEEQRKHKSRISLAQKKPPPLSLPKKQESVTTTELDVATPSSLNGHPFFVSEELSHRVLPPDTVSNNEKFALRTSMDKKLREDLDEGVYATLKAREGMNRRPIQTVREEADMPDNEVLETKLQKKYPLNGTRLRMSISAGDLIGKTHDELVLLLIQLRRNQSALEKARDFYRESLGKRRSAEREYRKQRNDSVGRLERSLEEGHQSFVDTRSQMEEVEKKLEVYRPLINLVDNMVTMGSLYGGDNLMLATQYRKHLLRPDQYQAPRMMLEFSRQHQENRVISGIENDVRQLTAAEVDLEEKIDRLNQLERLLQEQSFKVSSFREDKELLEKALAGIQRQIREGQDSPRDLHRLRQQQNSVEKELSRVTQDLAEASKALEETTVENNKIEHEVALLRTKVHGELKRSKSAPSLATENANTKVKMERELARVQNMLQGLSQQGEKLSQQMSTIRRSSSGTQLAAAFDEAEKSRKVGTYMQTDLDSGHQVDLAQQIPVHSSSFSSPFSPVNGTDQPMVSHQRQESTHGTRNSITEEEARGDWDIGDADDNTKRFYGLLPKERPKSLTVRDVKRQSEQRRERKRDEEGQDIALKVSSTDDDTSTFIHTRYSSYASSQSSGLDLSARDSSAPLYENLPRAGSMPALNHSGSAPGSRRSSISLITPKPFVPYQDKTAKPFRSELALHSANHAGEPGQEDESSVTKTSRPFASEMDLNSSWNSNPSRFPGVLNSSGIQDAPLTAGQVGVVTARPLQLGRSMDNIPDYRQPGITRSSALPTYTRVPQPFKRDEWGVSQSTPHLNILGSSSLAPFTGVSQPSSEGGNFSRVYAPKPWVTERSEVPSGLYDAKKSPKGRYMTVSSSQPTKLESNALLSPAGDLLSDSKMDDVPDVVKSSLNNVDKIDHIDHDMIDREILYFPEKVLIPERYDAEADAEHLTEAQKAERQEKADRIKRLLTNQSVMSMSQPDISYAPPTKLHNQMQREKAERAHFLTLTQELARQVTQQSKKAAAERRKTWSGGQIADIKAQYEAELARSPEQFDHYSRSARQANILL